MKKIPNNFISFFQCLIEILAQMSYYGEKYPFCVEKWEKGSVKVS